MIKDFAKNRAKPICLALGTLFAGTIGFLASLETLSPRIVSSLWSNSQQLREKGADCRNEGYIALRANSLSIAKESFECATSYFYASGEKGDALGWYGLAILFGDDQIDNLLPATRSGQPYFTMADLYWCRARNQGLEVAAHIPPHRNTDPC